MIMRSVKLAAVSFIGLGITALPAVHAAAAQTVPEHIIATLYEYPGLPDWNTVVHSAPAVTAAIADICDTNGDGSGCDQTAWTGQYPPPTAWFTQISALQAAKITPLIYIATDYGDQDGAAVFSLATVESEVRTALSWFGTGIGFMFDQAPTSCTLESSYYAPLYKYVKSVAAGAKVELNAGTVSSTSSCYLHASDVLQVFEGSEAGFQATTFPSWLARYPAGRFAATISAGTAAGVGTDVTDAGTDRIGNIYVDDEPEPPNYATLAAFWSAEVADVAATDG